MKIALYGHGKMGSAIEEQATARGHEVILRVTSKNAGEAPTGADVAIEFSTPKHALANMRLCVDHGVPVVVGTTGWYDRLAEVERMVAQAQGGLLWASNFSIGVNLLFRVNRYLATLMDDQQDQHVHIEEVHHVRKVDAPSGTAITLARDIDLKTRRYTGHVLVPAPFGPGQLEGQSGPGPVPIVAERTGDVTGEHSVIWTGPHDRITLRHEAFDRNGFALGAVRAAEWLVGRKGLYSMDDLLDHAWSTGATSRSDK
ncbi:MAG: 4-hydroxy-tetrahydrodipicolinate reductase [Flavobacteriales bacterium]